ncbi:hypothetical protein [uncultured Lamprocystis sp.]|uniref:hypothetical protein n=1 Tax=uncultured Lamprocystis sp. TaxID=543132 RepID=UPI0025D28DBB|nr:hypothetical protein [uncultured Lamprocystis sp.]
MGQRGGRAWVLDADVWGPGLAAPGWLRGTVHGTGFRHPCRNDGLRDPRRPAGRGCGGNAWLMLATPGWLSGTVHGTDPRGVVGSQWS